MIADKVCNALASYLAARAGATLDDATVTVRGSEDDLVYPSLVVAEDGAPEQDPLLRREWTVPVRVLLRTIPEDTTAATHEIMTADLRDLLGDVDGMIGVMAATVLVHDVYEGEGETEPADKLRESAFRLVFRVRS